MNTKLKLKLKLIVDSHWEADEMVAGIEARRHGLADNPNFPNPPFAGQSGAGLAQECADLFRSFSKLMRGRAYRVTRTWHDAEDAVQTIFLKLLSHGISPELRANPERYLRRAAFNEALKIVQTQQRRGLVEQSEDENFDCVDCSASRLDDVTRARLQIAMAQLKPIEREVLNLSYWQGYSDMEIAVRLGQSHCWVRQALSRSRARLKCLMS